MQNKLTNLNNHLFETIERLNDDDLMDKELETEIRRAKAIAAVGTVIVNNGNLALKAAKHMDEYGTSKEEMPEMLQLGGSK